MSDDSSRTGSLKTNILRAVCLVILLAAAALILVFVWNMKFRDLSVPVEHKSSISDGSFSTTVGMVRQIAVRDVTVERRQQKNVSDITIEVYDMQNNMIWVREYDDLELSYDMNIMETFDRDNALYWDAGDYRAVCYENGEESHDIVVRFTEYNGNAAALYLRISICALICLAAAYIVCTMQKMKPETTFAVMAFALGIFSLVAFTPMSAGDELFHFIKAYDVSVKTTSVFDGGSTDGELMVRADDFDSLEYLHDISGITGWYASGQKGDTETLVPVHDRTTVSKNLSYVYVISSLGITIARVFGLSGHTLILLGEIFNLIAVIIIMAAAIRITPWGKWYFACVGLIPEVLYLGKSYSYDGINLALCMLITALFMNMYFEEGKIGIRKLLAFVILLFLMMPIKVVYAGFGILLLLLPADKLSVSKKKIAVVLGVIALAAAVFLVLNWSRIFSLFGSAGVYSDTEETGYSAAYVFTHLRDTLLIYLNSFLYDGQHYVSASFGEVLGRDPVDGRDLYVIPGVLQFVIIFALITGLQENSSNTMNRARKIIIGVIGIVTYLLIYTAMLFSDTLISDWKISGTQGRYFLPILLLIPLMFKNSAFEIKADKKKTAVWSMTLVNICYIVLAMYHYCYYYFAE